MLYNTPSALLQPVIISLYQYICYESMTLKKLIETTPMKVLIFVRMFENCRDYEKVNFA